MSSFGARASVLRHQAIVAAARATGDPLRLAHAIRHLGDAYREADELQRAETHLVEAVTTYRREQRAHPLDVANALRSLALLREARGAAADAIPLWQEAGAAYEALGLSTGVAECAAHVARLEDA